MSVENRFDTVDAINKPFKTMEGDLSKLRQRKPVIVFDSSLITTDTPTIDKTILESVH